MSGLDPVIVRGVTGGVGLILMCGLYAWRIFKSHPGDRFMESGSVTLMIFVVVLASRRIPNIPDWVFNSLALLLGISTFVSFLHASAGLPDFAPTADAPKESCKSEVKL